VILLEKTSLNIDKAAKRRKIHKIENEM